MNLTQIFEDLLEKLMWFALSASRIVVITAIIAVVLISLYLLIWRPPYSRLRNFRGVLLLLIAIGSLLYALNSETEFTDLAWIVAIVSFVLAVVQLILGPRRKRWTRNRT